MDERCLVLLERDSIEPRTRHCRLWCLFKAQMPLRQCSQPRTLTGTIHKDSNIDFGIISTELFAHNTGPNAYITRW